MLLRRLIEHGLWAGLLLPIVHLELLSCTRECGNRSSNRWSSDVGSLPCRGSRMLRQKQPCESPRLWRRPVGPHLESERRPGSKQRAPIFRFKSTDEASTNTTPLGHQREPGTSSQSSKPCSSQQQHPQHTNPANISNRSWAAWASHFPNGVCTPRVNHPKQLAVVQRSLVRRLFQHWWLPTHYSIFLGWPRITGSLNISFWMYRGLEPSLSTITCTQYTVSLALRGCWWCGRASTV